MKKSKLSFHQRIENAIGSQELERKKAIHSYVHTVNYENEEFDRLWVHSANSTWGHNFGQMVGMSMIYYNHIIGEMKRACENHFRAAEQNFEIQHHDIRSTNSGNLHALSEGCVEVAEDGMSARGWFLTPGTMIGIGGRGGGRSASFLWEYYGCDFVKIDGEWKYLHEHVCPVISAGYDDSNWAHEMYLNTNDDPSKTSWRGIPCEVGVEGPLSMRYELYQPVQHLIYECPEPYKTLDDEHSYSPGHNDPYVVEEKPFTPTHKNQHGGPPAGGPPAGNNGGTTPTKP